MLLISGVFVAMRLPMSGYKTVQSYATEILTRFACDIDGQLMWHIALVGFSQLPRLTDGC